MSSDPRRYSDDFASIHFCKPEAFAAKVFQGGADKVQFLVVDDEKAIVVNVANMIMLPLPMLPVSNPTPHSFLGCRHTCG